MPTARGANSAAHKEDLLGIRKRPNSEESCDPKQSPPGRDPCIVFASKLDLRFPSNCNCRQRLFRLPPLKNPRFLLSLIRNLWWAKSAHVIFISNPEKEELLFLYLVKTIYGRRLKAIVFDLIMRAPESGLAERMRFFKRILLTAIDQFIFIHRDTSGYEQVFGIPRTRCEYVPFKANNLDLVGKIPEGDEGYIVSLGASHRDYKVLLDAVRGLPIRVKLIVPKDSLGAHRAVLGSSSFPENVEHVGVRVDRMAWNTYIAGSRMAVVPILPDVIQPAGISVYLEAMAFGKPVVVTRGASTEGLLDPSLAVVVPPGDTEAMRKAITDTWNDHLLRAKLAENGRRYALSLGNNERLLADLRGIIERASARDD